MGRKEGLLRAISGFWGGFGVFGLVCWGWLLWPFLEVAVVCLVRLLWPFLDVALVWLVQVLWPFLEIAVVYWRCPCAGRHLLSLLAAKKVGKESSFTPLTLNRVP
jgi:hypothetical protein